VRIRGTAEFIATRGEVWPFLVDPTLFGPCSPYPIERVDDTRFFANARIGSGMFSATIRIDIEVTDVVPGEHSRMTARGSVSGMTAEGSLDMSVRTAPSGGRTSVDWELEVRITGSFAAQASRIVEEHAPEAVEQLVTCIHRQVEA